MAVCVSSWKEVQSVIESELTELVLAGFGLHEGHGVSAGRFVSSVVLMRSKHKPSASLCPCEQKCQGTWAHPLPSFPY